MAACPDGWPDSGTLALDKPFSRATLLAKVSQLVTEPSAQHLQSEHGAHRLFPHG